jgi:hypothetical protein
MRRAAMAALVALSPAVGCGADASDPGSPVKLADEPRTIDLGLIGAPLAVDGDALVHVAYRQDQMLVVRRDLRSGAARTLLRRPAEPWSADGIAARDGRVAVELSAPLRSTVAHRILEPSPSRERVLARARDGADCGAKVAVHNLTPAREVLVSEVRVSCGREPRGSLTLRLHGAAGSRTVVRRQISPDRASRLITEPVLHAGVGGARMVVADPEEIEIVESSGRREVIERRSSERFAGAEINDHGDLLFHAVSEQWRTSLIPRGQTEPVELVEAPLGSAPRVRLCGDLVVRYARRGSGEAELSVAPVSDPKRYRRLRAWPARLAEAELICDQRRAVLIRQRGPSGPSSAEVVGLPMQPAVR